MITVIKASISMDLLASTPVFTKVIFPWTILEVINKFYNEIIKII